VQCTRCARFACPECLRTAPVGHQCADCVSTASPPVRDPAVFFRGPRTGGTPVVTYVLIAINVAMFVVQRASPALERRLVLWPPAVATGETWRIFTSAFLHYGLLHIAFNMWALWLIGPSLEKWLGRPRFVALYVLSALGGGVLVYLLAPLNSATAGASGAIFGLFGAAFVVCRRSGIPAQWIAMIIAVNLAFTFAPALGSSISWQGHVGGLLTGALVACVFAYAPRNRGEVLQIGANAGLLAAFAVLIWWRTGVLLGQFA
jgi:membrane associated rhomboid family serine protease